MTYRTSPPFRAEHVGSLLRPAELLEARDANSRGELSAQRLRGVEDHCIREIVSDQEKIGFKAVTDGEFRRTYFHIDFLERLEGVTVKGGIPVKFRGAQGEVDFAPPRLEVTGKLRHVGGIQTADFTFLKGTTTRVTKVCIPSPTMVHFRGGRAAIDTEAYPDLDEFFDDLAQCYRDEIAALAAVGCRYVQLDDTNLAYLCDDTMRQGALQRGDDPRELPRTYAKLINDSIRGRPADMTIGIHLCRGNFQSAWVAEGGYDPVAEILFNEIDVDGFFLEYDDHRSGSFEPLRFVPRNKIVVLGLLTSKVGDLEPKDELKHRIDDATQYLDLEQICLSPQCGFSSTVHGNRVTQQDQDAKLKLVVETAAEVWG
ncbi:MAG: 5-methyltetrahydropteroyltriglutamate--homocysteine S-methyltransferase [Gammaproteobacteria bacterium]|nr:5-methyltetrahydropteroyltriglutamate--homocysteine S-methyltransferase [Gammaproteobacteria bacterium]